MSENFNSNQNNDNSKSEEVDLIVLFNYIGDFFRKIFAVIGKIILLIFSAFISLFKVLFQSWKIIVGVVLLAFILGFAAEKFNKKIYSSSMLVEPFYDSKYQLVNNIEYFNTLIAGENIKTLRSIFSTDAKTVAALSYFEIEPGPESENEKRQDYERYLRSMDSTRSIDYSFEDFIENRDIYAGRLFEITAYSTRQDVFPLLELGIEASFTNEFSKKAQQRRSQLIDIQKKNLEDQLEQINALQTIYIDVLQVDSKRSKSSISLGGSELSLGSEKQDTKEYELLQEEKAIRDQLKNLEEQKLKQDDYFETITSFQSVGNKENPIKQQYKIIFPVLAFVLLCLFFLISKFVKFTLNYEKTEYEK